MTPQESELVDELFNRLVQLETAQRDPEAERLIADGLRRAPHAVYALVQTVLLQDEALKRANARIEELQVQTNAATEPEQRPASFLDSMREALGGRAHGSVPSVRRAGANQSQGQPPQPGYPGAPGFGSGGSFLGTAASAAAGVIGGSLLLDGVRSAITSAQPVRVHSHVAMISSQPMPTENKTANRIWQTTTANRTANRIWLTKTLNKMPNKIWPTKTLNKTPNKISPTKTLNKTASKT
jgi:hypothetical protein